MTTEAVSLAAPWADSIIEIKYRLTSPYASLARCRQTGPEEARCENSNTASTDALSAIGGASVNFAMLITTR